MKFRCTNDRFGDGIFEADSKDEIVRDMDENLETWAREALSESLHFFSDYKIQITEKSLIADKKVQLAAELCDALEQIEE